MDTLTALHELSRLARRRTCDVCGHKLAEGRVVNAHGDVECPDCGAIAEVAA